MNARVLLVIGMIAAVLLVAVMQSASPSAMHPLGILAVFFLLYVVITTVFTIVIHALLAGLGKGWRSVSGVKKTTDIPFRRSYAYASIVAFAPVVLIAMQSVGQLGWADIALVIIFELIACFYISRRS